MRSSSDKILITGGAGFVGSEFVRQALAQGRRAVVADKTTSSHP